MKKIYYLILYVYFFGCAVQGPISGGPVDKTSPVLLSVFTENFSTEISDEEKFNAEDINYIENAFEIIC